MTASTPPPRGGGPADSVKIGISEFCPKRPDLVVSGINGGLNAGINVLYSGTVAAAIEGAFFGITSVAVSLEWDEHAQFDKAADIALWVIEKILANQGNRAQLYNLNIPTKALDRDTQLKVVPMAIEQYGENLKNASTPAAVVTTGPPARPPPPAANRKPICRPWKRDTSPSRRCTTT